MNAQDANSATHKVLEEYPTKMLDKVFNKVSMAIQMGLFDVAFHEELPHRTIVRLQELGYTVNPCWGGPKSYLISWEKV